MIGKQMLCILRLLDCCDLQSSEIAPTILLAHCFSFNCKIQIDAQPMFVKFSGAHYKVFDYMTLHRTTVITYCAAHKGVSWWTHWLLSRQVARPAQYS